MTAALCVNCGRDEAQHSEGGCAQFVAPPREMTQEELQAEVEHCTEQLALAQRRYKEARQRALTDPQGRLVINPFQMQLEVDLQKIRTDAILLVLSQMGINIALPVTQVMPQLFDAYTEQLGRVQIARGVNSALHPRKPS